MQCKCRVISVSFYITQTSQGGRGDRWLSVSAQCSSEPMEQKLELQNPGILSSIPTSAHSDLAKHSTGMQSCITTVRCTSKSCWKQLLAMLWWTTGHMSSPSQHSQQLYITTVRCTSKSSPKQLVAMLWWTTGYMSSPSEHSQQYLVMLLLAQIALFFYVFPVMGVLSVVSVPASIFSIPSVP